MQSSIHADGFRSLAEGEVVEFSVETGDDGRTKAVDVTGPEGNPVQVCIYASHQLKIKPLMTMHRVEENPPPPPPPLDFFFLITSEHASLSIFPIVAGRRVHRGGTRAGPLSTTWAPPSLLEAVAAAAVVAVEAAAGSASPLLAPRANLAACRWLFTTCPGLATGNPSRMLSPTAAKLSALTSSRTALAGPGTC